MRKYSRPSLIGKTVRVNLSCLPWSQVKIVTAHIKFNDYCCMGIVISSIALECIFVSGLWWTVTLARYFPFISYCIFTTTLKGHNRHPCLPVQNEIQRGFLTKLKSSAFEPCTAIPKAHTIHSFLGIRHYLTITRLPGMLNCQHGFLYSAGSPKIGVWLIPHLRSVMTNLLDII